MRHWRHVADLSYLQANSREGAQRAFTTRTRTMNFNLKCFEAVFLSLFSRIFRSHLSRVRCGFPRPFEAHRTGGLPLDGVALYVRDQDLGVVEGRVYVGNARCNVLPLFALSAALCITCHVSEPPLLLLACDGLCGAFAGTSVGVCTLTAHGEVTAMAQTAVAAKVHQTFDVHLCVAAKVAFDSIGVVDVLTDREDLSIGQLIYAACWVDTNSFTNGGCGGVANASDIRQGDWNALPCGDVNARNTCQNGLPFGCVSVVPDPFFTTTGPSYKCSGPAERYSYAESKRGAVPEWDVAN